MRKILYILAMVIVSCNSENAGDCFQIEGSIIQTQFPVSDFTKVRIEGEVSLVVKHGDNQEVIVESGENLFSDIEVIVEGETLIIRDNNKCNLFRDYGVTVAYVTTSDLLEIRNSSSFDVHSDGLLRFPRLQLVSTTAGGIDDVRKGGDFFLNLECDELLVSANGQSIFYLTGASIFTRISFTDEWPRFEGGEFEIQELEVFQRSANNMIVNPQLSISGEIRGTGDIISMNRPPIVEVEEFFTGRLFFED